MHDGYLICDVHFVYLTPRVPANGLVALRCNLFNVLPGSPPVQELRVCGPFSLIALINNFCTVYLHTSLFQLHPYFIH